MTLEFGQPEKGNRAIRNDSTNTHIHTLCMFKDTVIHQNDGIYMCCIFCAGPLRNMKRNMVEKMKIMERGEVGRLTEASHV